MKIISALSVLGAFVGASVDRSALYDYYKGINKDELIWAVNCGSEKPLIDKDGVEWQADSNYEGGIKSSEGNNHRWIVPNADIYHSERWSKSAKFSYFLPVYNEGHYTLVLKFSEIYFDEPGEKVFNVYMGDSILLHNLDPVESAGSKMLPHDEFLEFEIRIVSG